MHLTAQDADTYGHRTDAMTHASASTRGDGTLRSAVPTFLVADVPSSAQWYTEHLGFNIAGTVPKQVTSASAARG